MEVQNLSLLGKVVEATRLVKERYPNLKVDGELQLDAAIIPEIAESKAPGSQVAGKCNTLIFPASKSGKINVLHCPATLLPGAFEAAISGIIALSNCNSPSSSNSG